MKYVEIYKLQNDGSQTIEVECSLTEQGVECKGSNKIIENFWEEGIQSLDGEMVFPKDGLKFLQSLKYEFKSGYMNASEVKEK